MLPIVLLCFLLFPTLPALAAEEGRGLEIAREADRRDSGFGDSSAELEMILRDAGGRESRRELRLLVLEKATVDGEGIGDDGAGDRSLVIFDRPADVEGTALLTHNRVDREDDQWLYLPALGRVKRISSANQSGPFMGSEFSYEDLSAREVEEYAWRFLRGESLEDRPAFVVERVPTDPRSGYSREVAWIDRDEYRTLRVDFYDRKGTLQKTLALGDFERYLDRFWRPLKMTMTNHQTGKSTELRWSNYRFRTGLDARDFDKAALARAR